MVIRRKRLFPCGGGIQAAAAFFIAAALAGCGPASRIGALQDSGEAAAAAEKAREAQLGGRIDEARAILEDIALARPADAMARLQLGILLQDLALDPYAALGEYRAYLRLAPGSEKEEMVRERIRSARNQIARKTASGDSADKAALPGSEEQARRIAELESELRAARSEAAAASSERDKLQSEADKLQREILAKDRQLDILQSQGIAAAPRGDLARAMESPAGDDSSAGVYAPPETQDGAEKPARTYKVRRGDTLWSVAQKAYGDASRTGEIRAANAERLRGGDKLVEGMVLVLPY